MTLLAKIASIILGISSALIVLYAAAALLGLVGMPGAGGVVLVDSIFGVLILFTASRLLWLYARKQENGQEAGQSADG